MGDTTPKHSIWVPKSREVFTPRASSAPTAGSHDGPISTTRSEPSERPTGHPPPVALPTQRASSSRRSVLRPSSPTLPSESVSVSSSSRTARRSPFRPQRRLPQLCRRERRGPHLWFRPKGKGKGSYPRCPFQGRKGLGRRSPRAVEGEEGEAEILKSSSTGRPRYMSRVDDHGS